MNQPHIKRADGPTILMGDGSYFDFGNPADTKMSIEDYAWALAAQGRWSGQTRSRLRRGERCVFTVCEHVVRMAEQMLGDGFAPSIAYAGLMHESDEIVFPDIASPAKSCIHPETRRRIKWWGECIAARFEVPNQWSEIVKIYDLRMLATEKRDLMPQGDGDHWPILDGYDPFEFQIIPWERPDFVVHRFLSLYERIRP